MNTIVRLPVTQALIAAAVSFGSLSGVVYASDSGDGFEFVSALAWM